MKGSRDYGVARRGFTIVELLIVIVVIAILAAVTIVAFNGVQQRARATKVKADIAQLEKAIMAARVNTSQTLLQVSGSNYTAGHCVAHDPGTDLAALPKTDPCWIDYSNALDKISTASGINVRSILDPWGRPYTIDENEGENGGCNRDSLNIFGTSYGGGDSSLHVQVAIPLSGFSGCAT